jgi:hypothetical protein
MSSSAHAFALCLSLAASSRAAAAEQLVGVSLEWTRGPGADACLSGSALRDEVRRRVTMDPFRPPYSIYLEGFAQHQGDTWSATMYLHRGGTTTVRTFASPAPTCESLGEAVALAAALLIEPQAKLVAPPAPPDAPPLALEPPAVAPPPAPEPAAPTPAHAVVSGQLTSGAVAGITPSVAAGIEIAALPPLLLARAGFTYVPERRATTSDSEIGIGITAVVAGVCGSFDANTWLALRGCADLLFGGIYAVVFEGVPEEPGVQRWAALAASAESVFELAPSVGVVAAGGVWVPFVRHGFRVSGTNDLLFRQPAVIPAASLGVRLKL